MESTARPLELVTPPARQTRETFAHQVLLCIGDSGGVEVGVQRNRPAAGLPLTRTIL